MTDPARPPLTRCAVLGSPISHSRSPAIHRAAYAYLGLDWAYERHEVDERSLAGFLAGLDASWRGLSLTMPLKEAVLELLDEVSPVARLAGAVNTVVLGDGRRRGDNTDVGGLRNALAEAGCLRVPAAAVLGGGATARSALVSLATVTSAVTVYVRTPSRAAQLEATAAAVQLQCNVLPWEARAEALAAPLVVSTTPSSGVEDLGSAVPRTPQTLLDVSYAPWPTALAAAWSARGGTVVSGLDLLVHQAALQVQLMTGRPAPLPVLRAAAG